MDNESEEEGAALTKKPPKLKTQMPMINFMFIE